MPLDSRKGQRDSRDPCVQHPKPQSQSHSNVQKQTGGQTSPPSFVSTPDSPVLALRGGQKPLYNNNISGSVSAATTVASVATLLLVWCGCAVVGCGRTKARTSAVHEPHRGLATPTHPPTPLLPPTPPPLPLPPLPSENWVNMCTSLASHALGSSSAAVKNAQDMQAVTRDMQGDSAERAKRFEHEAMAPGTPRETMCGTNRTPGTRSARTYDLVRPYPSLVLPPPPP